MHITKKELKMDHSPKEKSQNYKTASQWNWQDLNDFGLAVIFRHSLEGWSMREIIGREDYIKIQNTTERLEIKPQTGRMLQVQLQRKEEAN